MLDTGREGKGGDQLSGGQAEREGVGAGGPEQLGRE